MPNKHRSHETNIITCRLVPCLLAILWIAGAATIRLAASTNFVVVGDDLQAKIDAASAGDVMVIQSGFYGVGDAITINKNLSMVRSGSDPAIINVPVSVGPSCKVMFSRIDFGRDMNIAGGDTIVRIHDAQGRNLSATGGELVVRRSTFDKLTLRGTKLEALRMTNRDEVVISGIGSPEKKTPAVLVQSRCEHFFRTDSHVSLTLGYYYAPAMVCYDTDIHAVGVQVLNWNPPHRVGAQNSVWTAVFMERCRSKWRNCQVFWSTASGVVTDVQWGTAMYSRSGDMDVANCDLISYGPGRPGWWGGYGIGAWIQGGKAQIINSFFHLESHGGNNAFVRSESGAAVQLHDSGGVSYDWYPTYSWQGDSTKNGHPRYFGPIVNWSDSPVNPINCRWLTAQDTIALIADSGGVFRGFRLDLGDESDLIHAGSKDPIHRNRDGTRNTIGSTGGPLYNPANATTDQPITFLLGLSSQRIVKGEANTVKMEAGAAAGH